LVWKFSKSVIQIFKTNKYRSMNYWIIFATIIINVFDINVFDKFII